MGRQIKPIHAGESAGRAISVTDHREMTRGKDPTPELKSAGWGDIHSNLLIDSMYCKSDRHRVAETQNLIADLVVCVCLATLPSSRLHYILVIFVEKTSLQTMFLVKRHMIAKPMKMLSFNVRIVVKNSS
ncbi:hypothetical protein TNCV_165481 [Trichonephila clavipes]|nr:hypothetical protein TNCV_165481 [Trichonephila clavipes]